MQKKIQLLQLALPLLTLFVIGIASFNGKLSVAKANSAGGSCQLTWNSSYTKLNLDKSLQDVKTALSTASLTNCTRPYTSCTLVRGSGDTQLDFENIRSTSPELVKNLENDDLALNCKRGSVGQVSKRPCRNNDGNFDCQNVRRAVRC